MANILSVWKRVRSPSPGDAGSPKIQRRALRDASRFCGRIVIDYEDKRYSDMEKIVAARQAIARKSTANQLNYTVFTDASVPKSPLETRGGGVAVVLRRPNREWDSGVRLGEQTRTSASTTTALPKACDLIKAELQAVTPLPATIEQLTHDLEVNVTIFCDSTNTINAVDDPEGNKTKSTKRRMVEDQWKIDLTCTRMAEYGGSFIADNMNQGLRALDSSTSTFMVSGLKRDFVAYAASKPPPPTPAAQRTGPKTTSHVHGVANPPTIAATDEVPDPDTRATGDPDLENEATKSQSSGNLIEITKAKGSDFFPKHNTPQAGMIGAEPPAAGMEEDTQDLHPELHAVCADMMREVIDRDRAHTEGKIAGLLGPIVQRAEEAVVWPLADDEEGWIEEAMGQIMRDELPVAKAVNERSDEKVKAMNLRILYEELKTLRDSSPTRRKP
ncbi:hypothetical protein B0T19DRAFT_404267 [Cercophora scortea]|uniref:Uncharacterized protein n=1 Tax=Cercophora scortea TaxID=314031 RepID=A0AAE0M5G0_9PEZI|nr:hypothetical protein B0T19DRAFT_404267 [Cercophora scortea]